MRPFFLLFCLWFSSAQAEKITVYLDWFLNPHHAPLVIGIEQGIFKKHGLEVNLIAAGGSEEGSRQVAAQNADFAVSKQSSHMIRVTNQAMPLVRIATLIGRPLECLISHSSTVEELKGKRIGYTSSSIEFATLTLKTLLAHHHLTLEDVTLVPITSAMTTAFLSGQVDAIFTAYRTFEEEDIRQYQPNIHVFLYEEHGIPSFEQVILVCHKNRLDQPTTKAFIQAIIESCQWIKDNPEQAWQQYCHHAPEQNITLNHQVFLKVAQLLEQHPQKLDQTRYQNFAKFLKGSQILTQSLPPMESYAREALE
jgi:putative hydroxymethylpyrimidine transport system substrate-binding protein